MTARHVIVVGSGEFARSICTSLAASPATGGRALRITVLARDGTAAARIARVCRVRAAVTGGRITFAAEALHDDAEVLARLRPDILVCCASAQSPYERLTAPSNWTDLVERAGFGITLPLQATVVARLARALSAVSPDTVLVNGCFPDAVNPLLHGLGLPVHCGIGNVATLAACLQSTLDLSDQGTLSVLAQHTHLDAPLDPADEVRVWQHGRQLGGVTALLAADRALPRRELNAIAGHAAARLIEDLATGTPTRVNLPGPLGLPGGYPVRVSGRTIALDLPAGVTRADAVAWNVRVGRLDGVQVCAGRVGYPGRAAQVLAEHLPRLAGGWSAADLDAAGAELTALRDKLRQQLRQQPRAAPPLAVGHLR
ncbi:MAG TPA: potassium transporter TrkA [Micromonosporaceae bacterium]|jgi:hypothetical protein|nr:potassium transporter TrkA [Micromonosporaceae bacterium]